PVPHLRREYLRAQQVRIHDHHGLLQVFRALLVRFRRAQRLAGRGVLFPRYHHSVVLPHHAENQVLPRLLFLEIRRRLRALRSLHPEARPPRIEQQHLPVQSRLEVVQRCRRVEAGQIEIVRGEPPLRQQRPEDVHGVVSPREALAEVDSWQPPRLAQVHARCRRLRGIGGALQFRVLGQRLLHRLFESQGTRRRFLRPSRCGKSRRKSQGKRKGKHPAPRTLSFLPSIALKGNKLLPVGTVLRIVVWHGISRLTHCMTIWLNSQDKRNRHVSNASSRQTSQSLPPPLLQPPPPRFRRPPLPPPRRAFPTPHSAASRRRRTLRRRNRFRPRQHPAQCFEAFAGSL